MTADIVKEAPNKEDIVSNKEDVIDLVGGDGLWQRCIFLVALFFAIPGATYNLSMSFLAPNMDHWCARPEGSNWTVQEWRDIAIPDTNQHCARYKEINETFSGDENGTIFRSEETILCDAWEYDTSFFPSTVVNQWDLVCDNKWMVSLSKSVFMAGIFVSNLLFGQLADSLGRRLAITASTTIAVFSATICAFSTSFMMFIVTRFFIALGIAGVYTITFVLLLEVLGTEQRPIYGIAMNFGWCIGFVSLPGIAYVLRDWFWIQVALTVPCVVLLGSWWLLPESPRWLMSKGRFDEATQILTRAAKFNGKDVADIDTRLRKIMERANEVHESTGTTVTLIDLFRTPGLWQMTLNIYYLWFVNSFVYYGLSLNTNELAGDPFVNFALCGAVEFPAYFLTIFAIRWQGRRNPLALAMIVSGVACVLVYFLPSDPVWLSMTVSMIGKFCITCSFAIIYVFTAEIFPTVVRNIGIGSAAMFSRIGSISAPFVRELGIATHPVVPQIVFGILAFLAGLLVFLLPETNNVAIPETLTDAASRNRKKTKQNGISDHVTVKLSNGDVETSSLQDECLSMPCPSPNPVQNGVTKPQDHITTIPEEDITKNELGDSEQTETADRVQEDNSPSLGEQKQSPEVAVDIETGEIAELSEEGDKTNL